MHLSLGFRLYESIPSPLSDELNRYIVDYRCEYTIAPSAGQYNLFASTKITLTFLA